jgi:hypothetical protein
VEDDISDLAFIRALRKSVDQYLRAVDGWEQGYRRFRDERKAQRVLPPDLEESLSRYVNARQDLTGRVPRSRRLCAKFGVRDPFPGLLRIELAIDLHQVTTSSAVGRNERLAIAECLAELEARCIESEHTEPAAEVRRRGFLRRIIDFFV